MSLPTLQVTIVDSADVRRTFQAQRVEFDCDSGHIDIRPGKPDFCQGFERGVVVVDDGLSVTRLNVTKGLVSLIGNAMNVVCGRATLAYQHWGEHPIVTERAPSLKTGAPSNSDLWSGAMLSEQILSPDMSDFPAQPAEDMDNQAQPTT